MGTHNVFDNNQCPCGPTNDPIVDKLLGNAYQVVKYVAMNMPAIKVVSDEIASILAVYAKLKELSDIQAKIPELMEVLAALPQLEVLHTNLVQLLTLYTHIDELVKVATGIDDIHIITPHLQELASVAANITEVAVTGTNITKVIAVANSIASVNKLAPVVAEIGTLAQNVQALVNINTNLPELLNINHHLQDLLNIETPLSKLVINSFEALRRTYAEAGLTLVTGSFEDGAKVTTKRDVVLERKTGKGYNWQGVIPNEGKVIPVGSTPDNAGGIGAGKWVDVSAITLRELTTAQVRESLRRSYADAGFNLVDGSFEDGGTLVNPNDVLLQSTTGKAFTGPAGTVPSGTNPASGGFVDISSTFIEARSFRSFGATGLGFADDYVAIQSAIDWAGAKKNRRVYGYAGEEYRITKGLVLHWDNKFYGDESSACTIDLSGTKIHVDADNVVGLRISRNYAEVVRPTVSATGRTNVTAYAIAPEDETQTSIKVSQMFVTLHDPKAYDCAAGIRFRPGPTVGGQDSGSFYHTVYSPRFRNVSIGLHFARSVTGSCNTTRVDIFSPKHVNGHCMFDIEAADTLNVYGGAAEFISNSGPHAGNPTIKVHKPVASDKMSSSNIKFWGFSGEAGTTPFDLMSSEQISLPGCTFFGYANEGVNSTYPLQNMQVNEGAVVSRAYYSSNSNPALIVRRDVGPNKGQAYLRYIDQDSYPAEFYSDRGFTFASPIEKCPAVDLRQGQVSTQIFGSTSATWNASGFNGHVVLRQLTTGSTDGGWYFQTNADVSNANDNGGSLGSASRRWSQVFSTTGTINTSDANYKTKPEIIPDEVLDAWGDVPIIIFKWLDAVKEKGDSARKHVGLIAQNILEAFSKRGLDAREYGLLCYDSWDDEAPEYDTDGSLLHTGLPAGERWGIRPDQCLFMEAAYQRRKIQRIEELSQTR